MAEIEGSKDPMDFLNLFDDQMIADIENTPDKAIGSRLMQNPQQTAAETVEVDDDFKQEDLSSYEIDDPNVEEVVKSAKKKRAKRKSRVERQQPKIKLDNIEDAIIEEEYESESIFQKKTDFDQAESEYAQEAEFDDNEHHGESPAYDGDKTANRRNFGAKWVIKTYNHLQGLGSSYLYDRFNVPEHIISRKNYLEMRMNNQAMGDEERMEYNNLVQIVNGFMVRRDEFHNQVLMDAASEKEATEAVKDFMDTEEITPKPFHVIGMVLAGKPFANLTQGLMHFMQYKTKF